MSDDEMHTTDDITQRSIDQADDRRSIPGIPIPGSGALYQRIAQLEAENEALRAENGRLRDNMARKFDRVSELSARLSRFSEAAERVLAVYADGYTGAALNHAYQEDE